MLQTVLPEKKKGMKFGMCLFGKQYGCPSGVRKNVFSPGNTKPVLINTVLVLTQC